MAEFKRIVPEEAAGLWAKHRVWPCRYDMHGNDSYHRECCCVAGVLLIDAVGRPGLLSLLSRGASSQAIAEVLPFERDYIRGLADGFDRGTAKLSRIDGDPGPAYLAGISDGDRLATLVFPNQTKP